MKSKHSSLNSLASLVSLVTGCALLGASASAQASAALIARGGSDYRIVLATNATPTERYAAEELSSYLDKISGARLPVLTEAAPTAAHEILIGDSTRVRELNLGLDFKKMGADGFALRTVGEKLVIAGGRPRGTLYGVYALLEEKLGVRWFAPELEVVPGTNSIPLPSLDELQTPSLEYREVFWTEMIRNADFAARHRLNGANYALTEKHGGRAVVYFPFVHSLDSLIPPDLFKEHPEYFPLIDGQRKSGYVQRCLANPAVVKMAISRVHQWIQEHPEATIISVSQNDTANYCQCPQCQALDEAEGSPSASMIRFVNAVAESIEREHPAVRIDTLAYQYTRRPPKTLRPRPNVIVRLCSIECCFAHPLADCPASENRRFRDDILAWQPVAPLLYVWDYTPNFAHYQQPFPNFDALQPNVKFFVDHNVKGLFEQGNYSSGGGGEMEPLRAYLLAKILWNPNTDVSKHTTEFLHAYYRAAAADLRAYLDLLAAQVSNGKAHAHIFDSPRAPYLNEAFLTQANQLFDHAEAAAENDAVRSRVRAARLPVWYVQLATDRVSGEPRAKLLRQFLDGARQAGISHISEGQGLEDWASKMTPK